MKLAIFIQALNSQDIKLAKSFQKHVRELEEESKGKYIAFVDDGKEGYDVAIELTDDHNIIDKRCDCPSLSSFCCHINAVGLAILNKDKPKKKARKKKPNKFEEMVFGADAKSVLEWLAVQMKTDKVLAKKFEIEFVQGDSISVEKLKELHKDLLQSVNGRKRTLSAVNAGKIIKLYSPIHERIFNKQIQNNIHSEVSLDLIIEMRSSVVTLHYMSKSSGKRIIVYLNKLLDVVKESVSLIDADAQRELVELFYNKNLLSRLSFSWVVSILMEMHKIDGEVKSDFINFILKSDTNIVGSRRKNEILFQAIKGSEFLESVIEDFPLERRNQEYNLELIETLAEFGKYENAIEKCIKVIDDYANYNAFPFYLSLINTLVLVGDDKRTFEYGMKYFRNFATLRVFNLLKEIAPSQALQQDFYKTCKNIKPFNFHDKNEAALILMATYFEHGKINKVFEIMKRYEVWIMPHEFANKLIDLDKDLFISIFLQIGCRFWQMDDQYYDLLVVILMKHFTVKEIKKLQKVFGDKRMICDVLEQAIMSLAS